MQHADNPILQVPLRREKIDQAAEFARVQIDGQGVDRKIAPKQIQFDGAHFDIRQGRRRTIIFHPRRGDIDFEPVRENHDRRAEFFVQMQADPMFPGIRLRKRNAVALDHDVDILVGAVEKQIAHETAHDIGLVSQLIGDLTDLAQGVQNPRR